MARESPSRRRQSLGGGGCSAASGSATFRSNESRSGSGYLSADISCPPSACDLDQLGGSRLHQVAPSRRAGPGGKWRELGAEQFGVGDIGVEQYADLRLAYRTRPVVVGAAQLVGPSRCHDMDLFVSGGDKPGETPTRIIGCIRIVHQNEVRPLGGEYLVDDSGQVGRVGDDAVRRTVAAAGCVGGRMR